MKWDTHSLQFTVIDSCQKIERLHIDFFSFHSLWSAIFRRSHLQDPFSSSSSSSTERRDTVISNSKHPYIHSSLSAYSAKSLQVLLPFLLATPFLHRHTHTRLSRTTQVYKPATWPRGTGQMCLGEEWHGFRLDLSCDFLRANACMWQRSFSTNVRFFSVLIFVSILMPLFR